MARCTKGQAARTVPLRTGDGDACDQRERARSSVHVTLAISFRGMRERNTDDYKVVRKELRERLAGARAWRRASLRLATYARRSDRGRARRPEIIRREETWAKRICLL
ncbi:hypothetical protein BURKHO8Y_140070 [Burkholderia sp. 8Y]|nr:hypothetical protein BURKHO8Y_140070 [Burkholderia sp. 8Y]